MNRTYAYTIANQVIGRKLKSDILKQLKASAYSIALDEASDPYGTSYLGICVKYITYEDGLQIQTSYLSLVELDETGKSGQAIYNKLHDELLKDPEIASNFMGISTD